MRCGGSARIGRDRERRKGKHAARDDEEYRREEAHEEGTNGCGVRVLVVVCRVRCVHAGTAGVCLPAPGAAARAALALCFEIPQLNSHLPSGIHAALCLRSFRSAVTSFRGKPRCSLAHATRGTATGTQRTDTLRHTECAHPSALTTALDGTPTNDRLERDPPLLSATTNHPSAPTQAREHALEDDVASSV
jgi:hypothetical protein